MSNTISHKKYFKYLKTISTIGTIYRFLFIYPFFLKYLGQKNIDYGCGIGQFLKYCKFFRKNILGLDINPYSIKYCKKNDLNCLLIKPVKNVCKIVSENNDCVILDNVLEHIENPSKMINDLKKIIRLKGYLIIGVPIGVAGFKADPDHKFLFSEKSLDNLLLNNCFKKIKSFHRPFKSKWMKKNLTQYCLYSVYQKND